MFARLFKPNDLPPIIYWLKDSTVEQQLIMWELLDRLLEVKSHIPVSVRIYGPKGLRFRDPRV